jgi:tetratricopeptide (TPR) repeat protein
MNFSFITSGEHWQQFIGRLLREELGGDYQPISSLREGDLGIDGYAASSRTVFQIYFPHPEPGVSSTEKVRRKIQDTTRKLAENAAAVEKALGAPAKAIVIVVPEDPPVSLIETLRTSSEVLEIWGDTKVSGLLSKHYRAVKDLLSLFSMPPESSVDAVLEEGRRALRSGELDRARQFFENALTEALLRGAREGQAEAELGLASLAMETGDQIRAEAIAARACKVAPAGSSTQVKGLLTSSRIAENLRKFAEADAFLEAAAAADGAIDADSRFEVAVSRVRIALTRGELASASTFMTALDALPTSTIPRLELDRLSLKARHARLTEQPEEELRYLTTALTKARADEDLAYSGDMALAIAMALSRRGSDSEAATYLDEAITVFKRAGLTHDAVHATLLLAKLHAKLGLADAARSAAEQAYADIHANPSSCGGFLAEAAFVLARLAAGRTEWDRALTYAAEAGADQLRRRHLEGQYQVLLMLIQLAEAARREPAEALSYSRRVREMLAAQKGGSSSVTYALLDTALRLESAAGNYDVAMRLLEDLDPASLPPEQQPRAAKARQHQRRMIADQSNVSSLISELGDMDTAPLTAQLPSGAERLPQAHEAAFAELLPWIDAWPEFRAEIYDFWSRGSFVRLLLHHRAAAPRHQLLEPAFVLSVEVASVEDARTACRVFLPIVDTLVLLWKGTLSEGITMLPVPVDYGGPGGWGYAPLSALFPPREGPAGMCCAAAGYGMFLPNDACSFYFEEAAWFVKRGRLLLFPAGLVGSAFATHGFLEKLLLQNLLDAAPVMLDVKMASLGMVSRVPLVVPYFPRISIQDLALVCDGEEERFRVARRACIAWGQQAAAQGGLASSDLVRINDELKAGLGELEGRLRTMTAQSSSLGGLAATDVSTGVILDNSSQRPARMEASDVAAAGLWNALGDRAQAAYPYWKSSSVAGGRWNIAGPHLPRPAPRPAPPVPLPFDALTGRAVHWFYPPRLGWTVIETVG